jgi:hypothetical protein
MPVTNQPPKLPQQLPVKWAVGIVALLILYGLTQPLLNRQFGWQLPGLAALLGESEQPPASPASTTSASTTSASTPSASTPSASTPSASTPSASTPSASTPSASTPSGTRADAGPADRSRADEPSGDKPGEEEVAGPGSDSEPAGTSSPAASQGLPGLVAGYLRDTGRQRYVSPAGLQYVPGSAEGHRLEHLKRHLADIPDRPGKHGVFDGDLTQALRWIDDAYQRGQDKARGVRQTQDGNRTIYEVPFAQPIGYVGGRDGRRDGHPPARRLRLVVESNRFITAFPF